MTSDGIKASDIPEFAGTDVISARNWCMKLAAMGITGFHADDGFEASDPAIAKTVNARLDEMFENAKTWPDPNFVYDLVGEMGTFQVEEDYPGFTVDRSIAGASRLGYESVPGMEMPSLIVEDMNQFVMLQFETPTNRLSEASSIKVVPTDGVRFGNNEPNQRYVNVDGIKPNFSEAIILKSFDEIDEAVMEIVSPIGPRL